MCVVSVIVKCPVLPPCAAEGALEILFIIILLLLLLLLKATLKGEHSNKQAWELFSHPLFSAEVRLNFSREKNSE